MNDREMDVLDRLDFMADDRARSEALFEEAERLLHEMRADHHRGIAKGMKAPLQRARVASSRLGKILQLYRKYSLAHARSL